MATQSGGSVLGNVVSDILLFPLWWYSHGLVRMAKWMGHTLSSYAKFLAVGVWLKNIFVPMFGQHDWQSRIISVFMRSVQIVARSVVLGAVAVLVCLAALLYVALPVVTLLFVAYHLVGNIVYA